jgi:CRISPR system Cascade subunit CasC
MKLLELHILQSFPVSCLNRDDVGQPKSVTFGGVNRARLSSQSMKRAIRQHAQREFPAVKFQGERSRFLCQQFIPALTQAGLNAADAKTKADEIATVFSKLQAEAERAKSGDVTTAVFLSPSEIEQIAKAAAAGEDLSKSALKATRLDAADIALFGRMVANDSRLNVEAASMFSHAISTHRCEPNSDFFSAIDDVKRRDPETKDAGAGMIGNIDFNAACYYRYCALNLDQLAAASHLGGLSKEGRHAVVEAFIHSVIHAVPGARRATMNADTLPGFVRIVLKEKGQPLQLVNAFEKAIGDSTDGWLQPSIDKLKKHHEELTKTWDIQGQIIHDIPGTALADVIAATQKIVP